MSRVLPATLPIDLDVVEEATDVLLGGGVAVFATDTVYGIGACIDRPDAISKIFRLKGRSHDLALPVLTGRIEDARQLARFTPAAERLATRHWPGPLTMVLDRRPGFREDLGGNPKTVGVRIPDAEIVRILTARCGPLAVTSANTSGDAESMSVDDALKTFGANVDIYLDGGGSLSGSPSTIVDVRGSPLVLRVGVLDPELLDVGEA